MKYPQNIFCLLPWFNLAGLCLIFLLTSLLLLSACSTGTPEKPLPTSISSPASLLDQGIQQYNNNNYQQAIHYFEKSLLQYRSIDNQTGITQCSLNLAKSLMAVNNNQLAAEYLAKAELIIKQEPLKELEGHLHLLNSSLAINNAFYDQALQELSTVLSSEDTTTRLAALKNRSRIAFIRNDNDKQLWLEKYKTLQQENPDNTSSHLARILRFQAELDNNDKNKTALLTQSLAISRNLAARTAIAATLKQWAAIDVEAERFNDAEDKYLRTLFIRHQLGDVKNTLITLEQLRTVYAKTNNVKQKQAQNWINKIENGDLRDWDQLFSDFETYPRIR